jgi:hypothetical protein
MNTLLLLIAPIFFTSNGSVKCHIADIDQHQVTYSVMGNERSTHYDKPIVLNLRNSGKRDVTVTIPAGTIFESIDTSIQNMVIFEEVELLVEAGKSSSQPLRGMCIEPHNIAPSGSSRYTYSSSTNPHIGQTLDFLNQKGYGGALAQEAIWTVIRRPEKIHLSGWNADAINETGRFLAEILSLPVPEMVRDDDSRLYSAPVRRAKVSANFSFYFPEETDVRVALFDLDGIMQRELYIKENARPGEYVISFSFDGTPYIGQMYQCKLIADGEVRLVRDLDLR